MVAHAEQVRVVVSCIKRLRFNLQASSEKRFLAAAGIQAGTAVLLCFFWLFLFNSPSVSGVTETAITVSETKHLNKTKASSPRISYGCTTPSYKTC